jgi:hypothetical protein
MKLGTKSLLFGVHQIFWHPITVLIAWKKLYGWPNWKELICIIIHDWGYWGTPNMDGAEGERHPEFAAELANKWFGHEYWWLCLFHSRHYARNSNVEPSRLCWADKLSILYDPWWFYLPRAWMSGELKEYRELAANTGFIPLTATHKQWFDWLKNRLSTLGKEKRADVVPYVNPKRGSTHG